MGDTPELSRAAIAEQLLITTHLSLWELLRRTADDNPEAAAVVSAGSALSYTQLVQLSTSCAVALEQMGIGHGSRVAYATPACPEWLVLHYALMRLGAVAVPLNTTMTADELRQILGEAACEHVIILEQAGVAGITERLRDIDSRLVHGARQVPSLPAIRTVTAARIGVDDPRDPSAFVYMFGRSSDRGTMLAAREPSASDLGYIVYTSGSTSRPKGAMLRQGAIAGTGSGGGMVLGLGPDDRFLAVLPPYHSATFTWITACHAVGASAHLVDATNASEMLDVIEHHRCTATIAVHTHLQRIMDASGFADRDCSSLRKIGTGGSPAFLAMLRQRFGVDHIYEQYACTESSGLTSLNRPSEPGGHGRPLPGIEIRIVDPATGRECAAGEPGEIRHRGWARFNGYVNLDDDIFADQYACSGDVGSLSSAGVLTYLGRYKMMIKTGGENVSEVEVETFLEAQIPGIEIAQVVGAPDPDWGEAVVAFVQFGNDARRLSADELKDRCRGKLAGFKTPKRFFRVEPGTWPVLGFGKIDKVQLRARAKELYPDGDAGQR